MPLFHFDLIDYAREPDPEGTELADVAEARVQALIFAGNHISDNPHLVDETHDLAVEVKDEQGASLFVVRISIRHHGSGDIDQI